DHERQRLAHMADDDLQFGVCVKHAAEDHPEDMQRRLDVPAPAAVRHHFGHRGFEAAVPGVDDRLRRLRGVEIDRQLQRLCAREHGPERPIVQITPAAMAVDHDALAAVLRDRPLEFGDRRRGIKKRHGGEAEEPVGMAPDRFADRRVGLARDTLRLLARELLDAGRGQRQRLHGDAGAVHVCRRRKMLLEGDRAHSLPPRSLSEKSRILLAAWRRIRFCLLMSKRYRPWKIDEPMLLPATVQEFVDKDHLARFVLNLVVEEIDLEEIERVYRVERGQPPFDPAMMTALLLYGYCNGVYSSRRIAKACRERVDFMSMVGFDPPDFRTISEFRKRHLNALSGLFGQVLRLCERAGLVKLGHVALDGTKIKANASKHKAMSYERMGKRAEELEAEVAGWMDAAAAADAKEDAAFGRDKSGEE